MRGLKRTGLLKFLLSASHPLRITLTLFTFIRSSLAAKKITIVRKCLFQLYPRSSRLQTLCSTHFGTHFTSGAHSNKTVFWPVFAVFTMNVRSRVKYHGDGRASTPDFGKEDKNMKNENRNEEAVSPVIATILMVAITVVLAGVLYVWASSLAEGNTDGNLALYVMDAEDANGSPSDGIEDNLVRVTMTQGSDINWAAISVKISVNNGAPVTCDNPGATGGGCVLVEFGDTSDQVWSVGDGVTIVESSALCAAGEVCTISVTITDTQEGKTLDESSSVAE